MVTSLGSILLAEQVFLTEHHTPLDRRDLAAQQPRGFGQGRCLIPTTILQAISQRHRLILAGGG